MAERTRETTGGVADCVTQMYASYGEPARFDSHLHPEITIWESDQPGPLIGLLELDRLRGARDAGTEPRPQLLVEDLLLLARLDQQRPLDRRPVDLLALGTHGRR